MYAGGGNFLAEWGRQVGVQLKECSGRRFPQCGSGSKATCGSPAESKAGRGVQGGVRTG